MSYKSNKSKRKSFSEKPRYFKSSTYSYWRARCSNAEQIILQCYFCLKDVIHSINANNYTNALTILYYLMRAITTYMRTYKLLKEESKEGEESESKKT